MTDIINIAIIGASGYTGVELIRILRTHPHAKIVALTGDSQAGKPLGDVYAHLRFADLPPLVSLPEVDFSGVDVAFCCLPHGTSQEVIAALPEHLVVIDLSADFRLFDVDVYAQWYGHAHRAPELQKQAVYGLSELTRQRVRGARVIANPGCYPTSALLPLVPLLQAGIVIPQGIVIDAKSGITGAGRSAKQANLFAEINDGISAYGVASHRHTPEIEQCLSWFSDSPVNITFTPHLMPMNRGMLSTIYVQLEAGKTVADVRTAWARLYADSPFVHVLPEGVQPTTHQVRGTNDCVMSITADRVPGRAIIVSVIDNLVKGASGQAVQNMNIRYGLPENTGLQLTAIFP
jgi:N-acetyl-gamma-glutamyl-phosphate reductase